MSCRQKLAHKRGSQGKPYNLDQATARNQGCNTAQCAPYRTDLVPIVIVASALFPNSRPRTLLPDSRSTCPPCRHQPLVSPPLILPIPLLLPRLRALRASHGVGRRTLARRSAVDAIVVAKLHLQTHRPTSRPPRPTISGESL